MLSFEIGPCPNMQVLESPKHNTKINLMKFSSEIRLHHGSLGIGAIDTPRQSVKYIRADMEGNWDKVLRV